jgi:cell division protein FtsB
MRVNGMSRILYILVGLFLIALLLLSLSGDRGVVELYRRKIIVSRLEEDIEWLKADNKRLYLELDALKNDPDYIEKLAREELGMIKPGELLILFPSTEKKGFPRMEALTPAGRKGKAPLPRDGTSPR